MKCRINELKGLEVNMSLVETNIAYIRVTKEGVTAKNIVDALAK
jgi:hypothetical protein